MCRYIISLNKGYIKCSAITLSAKKNKATKIAVWLEVGGKTGRGLDKIRKGAGKQYSGILHKMGGRGGQKPFANYAGKNIFAIATSDGL